VTTWTMKRGAGCIAATNSEGYRIEARSAKFWTLSIFDLSGAQLFSVPAISRAACWKAADEYFRSLKETSDV
jgi:hypothetical protein